MWLWQVADNVRRAGDTLITAFGRLWAAGRDTWPRTPFAALPLINIDFDGDDDGGIGFVRAPPTTAGHSRYSVRTDRSAVHSDVRLTREKFSALLRRTTPLRVFSIPVFDRVDLTPVSPGRSRKLTSSSPRCTVTAVRDKGEFCLRFNALVYDVVFILSFIWYYRVTISVLGNVCFRTFSLPIKYCVLDCKKLKIK